MRRQGAAVGDGPQGEEEVVGDKGADVLVAHESVLHVEARLPAARQVEDLVQFRVVHLVAETGKLSGKDCLIT